MGFDLEKLLGKEMKKSKGVKEIEMPAKVNGYPGKNIYVKVSDAEKIEIVGVQSELLIYEIESFLDEKEKDRVISELSKKTYLEKEDLTKNHIGLSYRDDCGCADISVPWEWLRPGELDLSRGDDAYGKGLPPDKFSGVLDFRLNEHLAENDHERSLNQSLSNQSNLSFLKANLISGFNAYTTETERKIQRTETAVVKNFNKGQDQIWVGDILILDFQQIKAPNNISGIGYIKKASPKEFNRKSDLLNLFLPHASVVSVFQNERLIKEINAPPGRLLISDLLLEEGQNDLRIQIKDLSTGLIKEERLEEFFSYRETPKGQVEYSALYGVRRSHNDGEIIYDDKPVAFLGGMYGVTSKFSSGGSVLLDDEYKHYELEERFFSKMGVFSIKGKRSQLKNEKENMNGQAGAVSVNTRNYRLDKYKKLMTSFTFGYQHATDGYTDTKTDKTSYERDTVSAKASLIFYNKTHLSIGQSRTQSRFENFSETFASLSQRSKLSRHWNLGLSAGVYNRSDRAMEYRGYIDLNYNQSDEASERLLQMYYDQNKSLIRARRVDQGDFSLEAEVEKNMGEKGEYYNLRGEKTLDLAKLGFYITEHPETKGRSVDMSLATSLAFTSEAVAISKPFAQSFVIFKSSEDKAAFDVSDRYGKKVAELGFLKTVLVPLPNFSGTPVSAGFLDPEYFTLSSSAPILFGSGYRTGSTYTLKADREIIGHALLLTGNKAPLTLTKGFVECAGEETKEFFTNGKGEAEFSVKRGGHCVLKAAGLVSEPLDLNWPMKFKDFDEILLKEP